MRLAVRYFVDHSKPEKEDAIHQQYKMELFETVAKHTLIRGMETYYFPTAKHWMEIADATWAKLDPPAMLEGGYYDPDHYDYFEKDKWAPK